MANVGDGPTSLIRDIRPKEIGRTVLKTGRRKLFLKIPLFVETPAGVGEPGDGANHLSPV